jgi:hypothetical protein
VKRLLLFAGICFVLGLAADALARDPALDLLVQKGIVTEDEVASAEAKAKKRAVMAAGEKLEVSGNWQVRYSMYPDDNKDDEFKLKRIRLKFKSYFAENWGAAVEYDFASSGVKDAYVTFEPMSELMVTGGKFKVPYAYENLNSSSKQDTIDRSQVIGEIASEFDIGAMVSGKVMEGMFEYGAAFVHGTGGSEDNDKKDVIGRVAVHPMKGSEGPLSSLMLAAALQMGDQPMTMEGADGEEITLGDEERTRYIGTALVEAYGLRAYGEYLYQKLEDSDVESDGFYVTVVYDIPVNDMIVSPVVKYEQFDPDDSVEDDEETVTTIGAAVHFGKKHYNKVEINYRIKDEEPVDEDNNELLVQWQHKF